MLLCLHLSNRSWLVKRLIKGNWTDSVDGE